MLPPIAIRRPLLANDAPSPLGAAPAIPSPPRLGGQLVLRIGGEGVVDRVGSADHAPALPAVRLRFRGVPADRVGESLVAAIEEIPGDRFEQNPRRDHL